MKFAELIICNIHLKKIIFLCIQEVSLKEIISLNPDRHLFLNKI